MSLTSYQAAPPCNKGTRKVLSVVGTVNVFFQIFPNSRLPEQNASGVLADSSLGTDINQKTINILRSQGGPSADLCVVRYIRSL